MNQYKFEKTVTDLVFLFLALVMGGGILWFLKAWMQ